MGFGYGTLQTVGSGSDSIWLVKVGGTRYEMGYEYGRLLANQVAGCIASMSAVAPFTEAQYAAAVAAMWKSTYFDTTSYDQELQGVADGCAAGGHPEITYEKLRRMQLIPDMSELGCSLFAAWGSATASGHLCQLRNLDWSMDTGIQDYPVVAIFEPDDGQVHAVIGFAGMLGVSGGGLNEHGIALSQIMGYFCDPETLNGIPFPILLREAIYHDTTLAEALSRITSATRTNNYYYGVSGPDGGSLTGRLLLTSNRRCDIYSDNQSVNPHPCVSPTPFHTSLNDVVYWRRHDGGGNQMFYNAITARYGNIDSTRSIEIAQIVGVSSTLLSVVYDATTRQFWVAFAEGLTPAHQRGYVPFDLTTPPYTTLSLSVTNPSWGSVTVDPNLPRYYDPNTVVTLTAAAVSGKSFRDWTVYDPNYPGDANHATVLDTPTIMISMSSNMQVEAAFKCGTGLGGVLPLSVAGVLAMIVVVRMRKR